MDIKRELTRLIRGGVLAAGIKILSALLTYLMLVFLARVTSAAEFGYFATIYSIATLLGTACLVGQGSAILRFWPEWLGKGEVRVARSYLAKSTRTVFLTLTGGAAAVVVGALWSPWLATSFAVVALAIAIGLAEFLLNASRARGRLLAALLPRDILWRAGVITVAIVLGGAGIDLNANSAGLMVSALLLVMILPQAVEVVREIAGQDRVKLSPEQSREFWSVSFGLWGVTTLGQALSHAVTFIVMIFLGPVPAGMFFAAQRTAQLISVALSGLNQVVAPQLSQAIHSGDKEKARWLAASTALAGVAGALVSVLVFLAVGQQLLGIFDAGYANAEALAVLLVLSIGQIVNAAAGPSGWLLQMGGKQHAFLRILVVANIAGLPLLAVMTYFGGVLGAALAVTATMIAWNVLSVLEGRRALGIDTTILGLLRGRGR